MLLVITNNIILNKLLKIYFFIYNEMNPSNSKSFFTNQFRYNRRNRFTDGRTDELLNRLLIVQNTFSSLSRILAQM